MPFFKGTIIFQIEPMFWNQESLWPAVMIIFYNINVKILFIIEINMFNFF